MDGFYAFGYYPIGYIPILLPSSEARIYVVDLLMDVFTVEIL